MQLLTSPASPFARKVRIMIKETGQEDDVELVQVMTTPITPAADVAAANPLKKIPALIRPDGPTLYDSRVITRYLDALENRWLSHLSGPLDMAQISIASALGYLDLRHDARGWRKGHDALDDWFAVFSQRPAFQETMPV